jgi:D-glycero-D-manno-heptose 1,7-bisphosphate phosphatase
VQLEKFYFSLAYNEDMFPAIFLDRDGVLIENRADSVRHWSHVTVLPKAIDALSGFQRQGFKIIIVTNQAVVGRGLMTLNDAQLINERLVETIKERGGWVDGVFMCPHKPEDNCVCRKPQPGLLLQAAREFSIELRSSWMVGDAWTDLLAGQAAGVGGTIMVRTGRGASQLDQTQPEGLGPFVICEDVFDAFNHLMLPKNEPTED